MGRAVVVLGAGYAGVAAANRIAAGSDAQVTVVGPRDVFVERIRLHRLAAGSGEATVPLRTVLHPRVQHRPGLAVSVGDGTVTLDDGAVLRFDRLVYAVGSGNPEPGAGAYRVDSLEDARRLHAAVAALPAGRAVTVVGGGLTGVETATELAAARTDLTVRLVTDSVVAAGLPSRSRERVRTRLRALGIELRERTRVTGATDLGADVVVWATPPAVPELARRSGLPTDDAGRLLVDATLTGIGDPRIVGAGDAISAPPEVGFVRASCQAAVPLGNAAGRTVLAGLAGRAAPAASVAYGAQCLALGPGVALVQWVDTHDAPRRIAIGGRAGAAVKEQVVRYTLRAIRSRAA
ncbi:MULTISPECIES: NAD(P)/FAD-dependent oxidoreductase [Pseudonocardia]|uniref:NADH dehydrogenase n=2 Tax=Pseudonocardia TaxID=1847 RepID=A0A1Y2MXS6_PSEAH|nr:MULTISPECIES: FAD-dependent oxidoreductase [Pseudonocardia]OSY39881.1 NADH dehydrogenase [Pseudonocardia autotrophica]TDN74477.1 NADH dehydrogenase FAD-containing subunit [Pseudonocardia autotrophica]BBG05244.1 dehydrogenase [Pseudonocardia autotrophica]GEC25748.1 dehydrogenase [Pseudonocardia saturnea]